MRERGDLATVLAGDDKPSQLYVASKRKLAGEAGMTSKHVGLPATAIPIGQSPGGLPVGAQIIGNTFADPLCLNMARWLETEWCGFVPPPHLA
mgnify:CR=1 FL=1